VVYIIFVLVRFEVFTAVTMKNAVFWDGGEGSYIAGSFRLVASLQPPAHPGSSLTDFSTLKMEAIVPPKRRFNPLDLHGATSQKAAFFMFVLDSRMCCYISNTNTNKAYNTIINTALANTSYEAYVRTISQFCITRSLYCTVLNSLTLLNWSLCLLVPFTQIVVKGK
jgi:hypothetical protein